MRKWFRKIWYNVHKDKLGNYHKYPCFLAGGKFTVIDNKINIAERQILFVVFFIVCVSLIVKVCMINKNRFKKAVFCSESLD